LGNSADEEQLVRNLSALGRVYSKEEYVITLVEKGIKEAIKILIEAEEIVRETQSFKRRLKDNFLSQIPLLGRKYRNRQPLIPLLNLMYSFLRKQFIYIEGKLDDIKKAIYEQHNLVIRLMIEVKKGKVLGSIFETTYYKEIEELHNRENEIIEGFNEESKSFRGKIAVITNKIQIRLNDSGMYLRHKNLAWLQVKVQMTPIVSTGTAITGFTLGPQFAIPMAVLLSFVNWSPTLAILAIEASIRLKGPLQRAKEFASLKARVAKLGLNVPKTIFNEPPVAEFN
jgi:hypothetical protein